MAPAAVSLSILKRWGAELHDDDLAEAIVDRIRADLANIPALYVGGRSFTPQTLEDYLQARINAASDVLAKKAAWTQSGRDYDAIDKDTQRVMRDLKRVVIGLFGDDCPQLADFGFTARRVTVLTEEQKAVAVAKRLATRKARGTMRSVASWP